MSIGTTSINQLPSQDISNHLLANQQHSHSMMPGLNNKQQGINMIINENTMYQNASNQERRLTTDDINEKIQNMNSTITTQPSQIPQSTMRTDNTMGQAFHQTTPGIVQQNELGHLLQSVNQLNSQQQMPTKLPILHTQPTNIDQMSRVNYMNDTMARGDVYRGDEYNQHPNYNTTMHGNTQERKTFYQKWFDELKIPLLICCLFFIFQMPFYKQNLHKHFKFLFQSDGNMNLYGYLSSSILFSVGYFILHKLINP